MTRVELDADGQVPVVRLDYGTPGLGVWCGRCEAPTGVRVPLTYLGDAGVSTVAAFTGCIECGDWTP